MYTELVSYLRVFRCDKMGSMPFISCITSTSMSLASFTCSYHSYELIEFVYGDLSPPFRSVYRRYVYFGLVTEAFVLPYHSYVYLGLARAMLMLPVCFKLVCLLSVS